MTYLRLFVGIPLDQDQQVKAAALQDQLRTWRMNVSWVKPGNLHLTLRFLGDVAENDVPRVIGATREAVAETASFSLAFTQLGAFPGWRRPRVIWVGPEREIPKLTSLARRLSESLAAAGFPGDDKPFQAHLTLGRVRSPASPKDAESLVASLCTSLGRLQVNEIVLIKSTLHPQGSIYIPLARFPLRGQLRP